VRVLLRAEVFLSFGAWGAVPCASVVRLCTGKILEACGCVFLLLAGQAWQFMCGSMHLGGDIIEVPGRTTYLSV